MSTRTLEFSLEPVDNHLLASLCGPLDENLRQVEQCFDVTVARRSAHFRIQGTGSSRERAAKALRFFYELAGNSKAPLSVDDIQLGLIELRQDPALMPAAAPREDADLGVGDAPVLLTKRADLHGRTPRQVEYLKNIQAHDITFGIGPAGTGKTFLAVACAVDAFEREHVQRIILTRPAVEAGERLGFLPGDLSQKVDPYLRPLYDALYDLMGFEKVTKLFEKGMLEVAPLAFMRGRTLNNAFIILDEAQNTSPEQMKMFLTRIGIGAKAVITGDPTQVDLPRGQKSGLAEATGILRDVRGIGVTYFGKEDVVRHPLVARIVAAYEAHQAKTTENA
jgi:phosphate starvation-inducible PhoH-like protein